MENILKQSLSTEFKPCLDKIIESNTAWYPREILDYITLNTIYSTLTGNKLEQNSELLMKMTRAINDTFDLSIFDPLVVKIPFCKYFLGPKLDKARDERNGVMLKLINDRVSANDKTEKTYIDYTHEMVVNGELTQDEEVADMFALFGDAMDTLCSSLEFAIVLLAKYTDVQTKVRKELLI